MSKIGRKPIQLGAVQVKIEGNVVHYAGKKDSGRHTLPASLRAVVVDNTLKIDCSDVSRETKILWGLHRALLANEIKGVDDGFQKNIIINGLGFKAVLSGKNLVFSLGQSKNHKIQFVLPDGISVDVDKTGQNLIVKGKDKEKVGLVCSEIRNLRPPEPYKATGIKLAEESIIRKAGKTKSA